LLLSALRLHWPNSRGLRRRDRRLHGDWLATGGSLRTALEQAQALFELPIAKLQFFVLAGELPDLILQLLNPDLRVDLVGLRQRLRRSLRTQPERRGQRRRARYFMKSGRHNGPADKDDLIEITLRDRVRQKCD
jgi:hypothetical protein